MKLKTCKACTKAYRGTNASRFCPLCRKKRQYEAIKRWRDKHPERVKELNRKRNRERFSLGSLPLTEIAPGKHPHSTSSRCQNFRADTVDCVLCAERGTEAYRTCFRRKSCGKEAENAK